MLELKNIKKDYSTGGTIVHALKKIDLKFRKSDFVSILGPSGCGKTTLLNIIGGLDKYSDGDLFIGGRPTRDFNDRDWDSYRNHSVGFVFQSYNLIEHQTVLQNVELALSLSGVKKSERRKKAVEALSRVGLESQINKKPSEMSGGQMQRVAIARAIVNDPEIILADEPTGALDTETSIQVMEILKEISADRLVIMVTHNPEIAAKYSTRIIRMLDGEITADSAPLTEKEAVSESDQDKEKSKKETKKPSMSIFTSFGLSLKNLYTKKARTILTSFAGSIGIIGIALIFAVSQGTNNYIDALQEDTLSSYPLTLEAQHMDMSSLLKTFIGKSGEENSHENDAVYQKTMIYDLINSLNSSESNKNDLKTFKAKLEKEIKAKNEKGEIGEAVNGVSYTYDMDMLIYTQNVDDKIIRSDTKELLQKLLIEYFGMDLSSWMNLGESYGMTANTSMPGLGSSAVMWQEMLSGKNGEQINPLLKKQYNVVYGSWPKSYNEIVLVLDKNNEIDDMTLYALGLKSKEEIDTLTKAAINKEKIEAKKQKWSYTDICKMQFRTIFSSDCYTLDKNTGIYTDLRESDAGLKYLYDNGTALKVSGIIRPSEKATSTMLSGSIGYTHALTEYVINKSKGSSAVQAQLNSPSKDIFTGLPFEENTGNMTQAQKAAEFKKYLSLLTPSKKSQTYIKIMSIPSDDQVSKTVNQALSSMTRADMEKIMSENFSSQISGSVDVSAYISSMTDEDITKMFSQAIGEQFKKKYAEEVSAKLASVGEKQLCAMLDAALPSYTDVQCASLYDSVSEFSKSTYKENLSALGYVELESPSSINIYASTFESKDVIEDFISSYNSSVNELQKISYTDYVGLMMSSVTSIINAITYVLIAFVAVSLIVSSIMIGVITLISVQERTKEIGILRAIGASKKNVSNMFCAETVIIGFASGAMGVLITYLLCIPINIILHLLTKINNLSAFLPAGAAIVLILISVLLTLFAGIIPSRSAAKKDPVVALRTE